MCHLNWLVQEGYAQVMVPVVKASLAKATRKKQVSRLSGIDKQAERRRKIIARNNALAEQGGIFKVHSQPLILHQSHDLEAVSLLTS